MRKLLFPLSVLIFVATASYSQVDWAERLSVTHYANSYIDVSLSITDQVVETAIVFDEAADFGWSPQTLEIKREVGVRIPIGHVDNYFIRWIITLAGGEHVSIDYMIDRDDLGRSNFLPTVIGTGAHDVRSHYSEDWRRFPDGQNIQQVEIPNWSLMDGLYEAPPPTAIPLCQDSCRVAHRTTAPG